MGAIVLYRIAFVCLAVSLTTGCDTGWFGLQCKYKCRCFYDKYCSLADQCFSGGSRRCQQGWFGTACQYVDLAQSDTVIGGRKLNILTDSDEATCLNQGSSRIIVSWTQPFLFTWLRVHFSKPSNVDMLSIRFKNGNSLGMPCYHRKISIVSETAVDIYCYLETAVTQVILSGSVAGSLCSIYISGGRNVALREHTFQTSTFASTMWLPHIRPVSSLAVDGNNNRTYELGDCTHTHVGDQAPSWSLVFVNPVIVTKYVIYNRDQHSERIKGFVLTSRGKFGETVFTYEDETSTALPVYTVIPPRQSSVSSVSIEATSFDSVFQDKFLSLCEVEVYGDTDCEPGWFGTDCGLKCSCPGCLVSTGGCSITRCKDAVYGPDCGQPCPEFCDIKDVQDEVCHSTTGMCTQGCQDGYRGSMCSERCESDSYGPDCKYRCPKLCQVDSQGGPVCDHRNGMCVHGCQGGYNGSQCSGLCDYGTYGRDCSGSCSQFCAQGDVDEAICNHIDGTCLHGCQPGYNGPTCHERCPNGTYGRRCGLFCAVSCAVYDDRDTVCHHIHGTCLQGCQEGYTGPTCSIPCASGTYGNNCSSSCSLACKLSDQNASVCDHTDGHCLLGCLDGYMGSQCENQCQFGKYGHNCSNVCPEFCVMQDLNQAACDHVHGACLQGCQGGYHGSSCNESCASGTYGNNCSSSCPLACKQSDQNASVCDHTDGHCLLGCQDGYMGTQCGNPCARGTYGNNCSSSCPLACKQSDQNASVCDHTDGHCLLGCQDGYMGTQCENPCESGTYGNNCGSSCPLACKQSDRNASVCDHTDGHCLLGCQDGYMGTQCENPCASGTYGNNCSSSCPLACKQSDQNASVCDHTDGHCLLGCQDGYMGTQCENPCESGTYGNNCGSSCPLACKQSDQNASVCDHTDGHCLLGCQDGYMGTQCENPCASGTYGNNCSSSCPLACKQSDQNASVCDHTYGHCLLGCQDGYMGTQCENPCARGTYGNHCSSSCPLACKQSDQNASVCDHTDGHCLLGCQDGYMGTQCENPCESGTYGNNCGSSCPLACKQSDQNVSVCDHTDGHCLLGCQDGYMGTQCENPCASGTYGNNCSSSCPLTCKHGDQNASVCDHTDGHCLLGCQDGYMGTQCENPCARGTYGNNCSSSCPLTCKQSDQNASVCDHTDGHCLLGCQDGYMGTQCENPCASGTYGNNCSSSCPLACKQSDQNASVCDHTDGHCLLGCQDGYMGTQCENPCASGTYGNNCSSSCPQACKQNDQNASVCDHTDGHCLLGCQDGYMGTQCENPCTSGTYGNNCSSSCPQACKQSDQNASVCDHTDGHCLLGCQDGYMGTHCENSCASFTYGNNCSSSCPLTCKLSDQNASVCDHTDGHCLLGCQDGYMGTQCENSCASGTYGNNCSSSCPLACKQSDQNASVCDHTDGHCLLGCQDGYMGTQCENPCSVDTNGEDCKLPCPVFCKQTDQYSPACEHIDGFCLQGCWPGYIGNYCDEKCEFGKYLMDCSKSCSKFCARRNSSEPLCDIFTGDCLQGCILGYYGSQCQNPCNSGTYGQDCEILCPEFCRRDDQYGPMCHHIDGSCTHGCVGEQAGRHCDERRRHSTADARETVTNYVLDSQPRI